MFNCLILVDDAGTENLVLEDCPTCGRKFAADRIDKHIAVCRAPHKQRKVFDSTKMRVQGTEAAGFVMNKRRANQPEKKPEKPNNWRAKHQEFIQAIRYAKAASKVEKEGGDVSMLAPPPRSTNPDYIQCPHCNRRFNQTAGERHIPKCKTTVNKPKPPPGMRNSMASNGGIGQPRQGQGVPVPMQRGGIKRF